MPGHARGDPFAGVTICTDREERIRDADPGARKARPEHGDAAHNRAAKALKLPDLSQNVRRQKRTAQG